MSSSLQTIVARAIRYTAYGIAAMAILAAVAYAILFALLQRNPQELTDKYLAQMEAEYGLKFHIGSIDVTLLPLPAVTVTDVQVSGRNFNLSAARVAAVPSLIALLRGVVFPGEVRVERPQLHMLTSAPMHSFADCKDSLMKLFQGESSPPPTPPARVKVAVAQFDANINSMDGNALILRNAHLDLRIRPSGRIRGELSVGSLGLVNGQDKTLIRLEGSSIRGKGNFRHFDRKPASIHAAGRLHWPGVIGGMEFDSNLESHSQGWNLTASTIGDLDMDGNAVPFALSGRAIGLKSAPEIYIRGVKWQLDADSGSANLALHWPGLPSQFALGGVISAHRLSLTQWLGFARNLAPGLQLALDNITDAHLEFMLNSRSLVVPSLRATCSGATFTGKGGVPNFASPIVVLNIASPAANLGLAIPESVGETPPPIFFPHPTMTPMPGKPLEPGETGIGYDIRLAADTLGYGPLKIQQAKVRIYPGKMDRNGLEDVLLDGSAQFYGGTVTGHCILGADKSLPIYISGKASKVNGAALGRDMPILPMRKGIWSSSATVNTKGKQLHAFLGNMRGDLRVSATSAALEATGSKNVFDSLGASGRLRSAAWNGKRLTLDGGWQGNITTRDFSASTELNGKLLFGSDGLTFTRLPGSINLKLSQPPLPANSAIGITGSFSGATGKNRFELSDGSVRLPGLTIHCDGTVDSAGETASGKLSATVTDPADCLARWGISATHFPRSLKPIKIAASYRFQEKSFQLTNISGSLGKIAASGSLGVRIRDKRPDLDINLQLGQLVLEDFIQPSRGASNWDFAFLTGFDAKGNVKCAGLNIYGQKLTNARAPFNLASGKLEISGLTAEFYGAPLKASLMSDFHHGLSFDSLVKVGSFSLENAARDRKLNILLTGQASFQAATRAKLSGKDKLAEKLQGQWQFTVFNGSWQSVDAKGVASGNATFFKNTSASGSIKNGLVSSKNFQLHGPTVDISGNGWYNMSSQKLECNLNVDLDGLPAFPLRLYGSANDVKTSIGAGKMLVNAVGDVASGLANAVGGVIKGAWNIFRR